MLTGLVLEEVYIGLGVERLAVPDQAEELLSLYLFALDSVGSLLT